MVPVNVGRMSPITTPTSTPSKHFPRMRRSVQTEKTKAAGHLRAPTSIAVIPSTTSKPAAVAAVVVEVEVSKAAISEAEGLPAVEGCVAVASTRTMATPT